MYRPTLERAWDPKVSKWWASLRHPPPSSDYSVLMYYLGSSERLGLWVSQYYDAIHLCLIPPLDMPCFPPSPIQSSDSTQTMFQPHSTRALACDKPTNLDSTRTAPMSMKALDCVLTILLPTNSNRVRRLPTICYPITVITPIPSSEILPLPTLHRWGEVLV